MSRLSEKFSLVLCEGKDDCTVFKKIAEAHDVPGLEFESLGGKDHFVDRLRQLTLTSDFTRGRIQRILITRDADNSWDAALQSLSDAVERVFGLAVSETGKWVSASDHCEIALWIVPGDEQSGMLETLCLQAAEKASPTDFDCLNQFADCLHKHTGAALHEKEKFAIWSLAAQEKQLPRQRLSIPRAIEKIPIDWKDSAFRKLSELLNEASIRPLN